MFRVVHRLQVSKTVGAASAHWDAFVDGPAALGIFSVLTTHHDVPISISAISIRWKFWIVDHGSTAENTIQKILAIRHLQEKINFTPQKIREIEFDRELELLKKQDTRNSLVGLVFNIIEQDTALLRHPKSEM